jgi:hypothetical protein
MGLFYKTAKTSKLCMIVGLKPKHSIPHAVYRIAVESSASKRFLDILCPDSQ